MKLIATMPVRNEAWCLGLSLRVALLWCDEVVVLNHASTDRTVEIIAEVAHEEPGRVHLVSMPDGVWTEMQHRQCLLDLARIKKATHIAIVDADEILTGNLLGDIPGGHCCVKGMADALSILQLPLYNLRGSLTRYHLNGIWGNRVVSVAFRDDERLFWAGDNFHHREPMGGGAKQAFRPIAQGAGGVMHLWGVSEKRLRAKHALYKLTERIRWPEKPVEQINREYGWAIHGERGHSSYGTPETWKFSDVPVEWWAPYAHLMKYLDIDAPDWQTGECIRLIKQHGPAMFKGLDLFGVV